MKFPCPYCHRELDLMELSHTSDLAAIISMSVAFGKHHRLVWTYAELFGITPLHAKAKKLRLILEEMKRLFDAQAFTYRRQLYPISADGIVEALNVVVKKSFADPLDSHNYLKKVMIGIADREGKAAGRTAEKTLRGREEKATAAGTHREEAPQPVTPAKAGVQGPSRRPESDAVIAENTQRVRSILAGIKDMPEGEEPRRTP